MFAVEHSFSITEKQIWEIREAKIKGKRKNRKRPSVPRRKNEEIKEKRRGVNNYEEVYCGPTSGGAASGRLNCQGAKVADTSFANIGLN